MKSQLRYVFTKVNNQNTTSLRDGDGREVTGVTCPRSRAGYTGVPGRVVESRRTGFHSLEVAGVGRMSSTQTRTLLD